MFLLAMFVVMFLIIYFKLVKRILIYMLYINGLCIFYLASGSLERTYNFSPFHPCVCVCALFESVMCFPSKPL